MDFQKLTVKSQEAVAAAGELARRVGNPEVYPEHLALALLDQELPRTLVERAGASVDAVREAVEERLAKRPAVQGGAAQPPRVSVAFSGLLDHADEERRKHEGEVIVSPASVKSYLSSTGLPGKFPARVAVTTVWPPRDSTAFGSIV